MHVLRWTGVFVDGQPASIKREQESQGDLNDDR